MPHPELLWNPLFGYFCHLEPEALIRLPVHKYISCLVFIEAQTK